MNLDKWLSGRLEERASQGLLRVRRELQGPQQPLTRVDGQPVLAFCSNDYLGLAADSRLAEAAGRAGAEAGFGGGASHLVNGHHRLHQQLEDALAAHTGREAALLFSTGYMANVGTLAALLKRGDGVFQDRLNHASLIDGALLSGATFRRFPHNRVAMLDHQLSTCKAGCKVVAVDGVYSMDGDLAPLAELVDCCERHEAILMVDDAHGFGVLGDTGAGICSLQGLSQDQVPVYVGTLGKALGSFGAFVAGSRALIDFLVQFARSYIYTTAMPPAVAAATLAALEIVRGEPERRQHLSDLIGYFRTRAGAMGLQLMDSPTAIQPVLIGDSRRAMALSAALQESGILVPAIRPPTVPVGSARLRITLSAAHGFDDVDRLLEALATVHAGVTT